MKLTLVSLEIVVFKEDDVQVTLELDIKHIKRSSLEVIANIGSYYHF